MGDTLAEQYGFDLSDNDAYESGDEDLFTKISEDLKRGTERSTYDDFFKMKSQTAEASFLDSTNTLGTTKSGKSMGFAGSTAQNSQIEQRKDAYAQSVVAVEEAIGEKQSQARGAIASIVTGNKQTMLQLKQMGQGDDDKGFWKTEDKNYYGQKKGTGWICARLKKEGLVSIKESLTMTKFFVKFVFSNPGLASLYLKHSRTLIKQADKQGFNWKNPSIKHNFITRVVTLCKTNRYELAYASYIHAYLNLCKEVGIVLNYRDEAKYKGILNTIKYWVSLLKNDYFRKNFFSMLYVSFRMRNVNGV